jgi:hypothetical protein
VAKFDGIVEIPQGLQANGGVGVLPTGLRLELVEESHRRVLGCL